MINYNAMKRILGCLTIGNYFNITKRTNVYDLPKQIRKKKIVFK